VPPFQAPPLQVPPFATAPPWAPPPMKERIYAETHIVDEDEDDAEWDDELPEEEAHLSVEDLRREMAGLAGMSEQDAIRMGLGAMKEMNAHVLLGNPDFLRIAGAVMNGQMALEEALPLLVALMPNGGVS
jgi:hypothetical protein